MKNKIIKVVGLSLTCLAITLLLGAVGSTVKANTLTASSNSIIIQPDEYAPWI